MCGAEDMFLIGREEAVGDKFQGCAHMGADIDIGADVRAGAHNENTQMVCSFPKVKTSGALIWNVFHAAQERSRWGAVFCDQRVCMSWGFQAPGPWITHFQGLIWTVWNSPAME